MKSRRRWHDPDKPVMTRGAERVFKWDSYVQLTLAGLFGIAVLVALVVSWFT